ncbi:E3 ubiquitin-protein ligase bre1 [Physocladia obscura]|uniref:E3 ubiquitin protein ligase n=1 Tax=Physocladia obscura TaxID=109957 RepID=A0AAD5T778_9FUNG|nr:E3 ubiquitin-protein ligase bre1 [Physocladia obscura]
MKRLFKQAEANNNNNSNNNSSSSSSNTAYLHPSASDEPQPPPAKAVRLASIIANNANTNNTNSNANSTSLDDGVFLPSNLRILLGDADPTIAFQKNALLRRMLEYRRLYAEVTEREVALDAVISRKDGALTACVQVLAMLADDLAAIRCYESVDDAAFTSESAFIRSIVLSQSSPSVSQTLDSWRSYILKSVANTAAYVKSTDRPSTSASQIDKLQSRCHILSAENSELKASNATNSQRIQDLLSENDSLKMAKYSVERKLDRLKILGTKRPSEMNGTSNHTGTSNSFALDAMIVDTSGSSAGGSEWEILANTRLREIEALNAQHLEVTQAFEIYKIKNPIQSHSELSARQFDEMEHLRAENLAYKKRLDSLTFEYEELQSERRKFIEQIEAEELSRRKVIENELKKLETDLLRVRAHRDSLQESAHLQKEKDSIEILHHKEVMFLVGSQKVKIQELESKIERLKMKLLMNDTDGFLHEFFKNAENAESTNVDVFSELKRRLDDSEKRASEFENRVRSFENASNETLQTQQILLSEHELRTELEKVKADLFAMEPDASKKVTDLEMKIEFHQKSEARLIQEIDMLSAAWTDLETQNHRKVFDLTEKENQILKLVAEKTKFDQKCEKLTKERNMTNNQVIALKRQSEKQLEQIRRLEERERLLIVQLQTLEKDLSAKNISADSHRRKVSELSQKQIELMDKLEKLGAKLAESEKVLTEKLKIISDDSNAQKRLLERIEILKKKLESQPRTLEMADSYLKQENEDLKCLDDLLNNVDLHKLLVPLNLLEMKLFVVAALVSTVFAAPHPAYDAPTPAGNSPVTTTATLAANTPAATATTTTNVGYYAPIPVVSTTATTKTPAAVNSSIATPAALVSTISATPAANTPTAITIPLVQTCVESSTPLTSSAKSTTLAPAASTPGVSTAPLAVKTPPRQLSLRLHLLLLFQTSQFAAQLQSLLLFPRLSLQLRRQLRRAQSLPLIPLQLF